MNVYTIYNKDLAPEALLNRHPNAPVYKDKTLANSLTIILFVTTLEDVTGTPAESIVMIDPELSNEELDLLTNGLLTGVASDTEYQISKPQGRYLYDTRFKQ